MENDRFQQLLTELARQPGTQSEVRNRRTPGRPSRQLIYVVDDNVDLTEVFRIQLEWAGYEAKTFADRAVAWTAFLREYPKPALLITDYDGLSMSAERLMQRCRMFHPDLKILMISGYSESYVSSCCHLFDRFLEKSESFDFQRFPDEVRSLIGKAE